MEKSFLEKLDNSNAMTRNLFAFFVFEAKFLLNHWTSF